MRVILPIKVSLLNCHNSFTISDYISDQVYPNSFFFDPVTSFEIEFEVSVIITSEQRIWACTLALFVF